MAAGARPKFTYMQKSDITAWALANAKGNDLCREMKTSMEVDPEVPDILFAKVFKARLLQLKDEGVERISLDRHDGDTSNRAKSSKRGKSAPVEEVRPESASKSESKRKNKIREKTGKPDLKPVASMFYILIHRR